MTYTHTNARVPLLNPPRPPGEREKGWVRLRLSKADSEWWRYPSIILYYVTKNDRQITRTQHTVLIYSVT